MQADNGKVYHFENGNKAGAPLCSASNYANTYREPSWLAQDLPSLTTMDKEQYYNRLASQPNCGAKVNFMRYDTSRGAGVSSMNNPNNPIWKPLDSKYLN
jgi:hypothetical protein